MMTCPDYGNGPLPGSCIAEAAYQGNCKGVLISLPSTASAVPISLFDVSYCVGSLGGFKPYLGPRGAQYSPVCDMSKVLIHSIKDFAASSGVTATPKLSVHIFMAKTEFTNLLRHPSTYQNLHPSSSPSSKPHN